MRVTLEGSLGVTVLGLVTGKIPDDQSLVSAGGEQHVGAERRWLESGSARTSARSWVVTYFSMEVARLVTQPFCRMC